MADSASPEDTLPEEERDFQKTIALIGGKGRIYVVSDACESKDVGDVGDVGILQEFFRDLFPGSPANSKRQPRYSPPSSHGDAASACCEAEAAESNEAPPAAGPADSGPGGEDREGEKRPTLNGDAQRTATRRANVYSLKRTIDSPIIMFAFRQTFLSRNDNGLCLKEILRDVKARTKRASIARPALIGLICTRQESSETQRCARLLERLIRAVFRKHSPEAVWVGCFVPKTEDKMLGIKKHACKVIHSSQAADNTRDRGNPLFWPFQCLFWPQRRGARGQDNNSSTSSQRGDTGSIDESIPLKTISLSAVSPVEGVSAGGDS